ncbi:MAG TPA: exopolysaccharide biosynthesis polyprenyl glycosylphosphotransferase, partial [Bdellovibrionales bacterium]|nr:exopolysaccharide biosynthesis polyprenyl glycosylphosphotransferase [Bdellovibrionales bacterium]
ISQYSILGFEVEEFDGLPILTLNQSPIVGWNAVTKRISDIVYSLVALILFSPLMLLIALLVKLTSRGPVLYKQERMGMDGRTFYMYKFRSMRPDAEAQTGAVWAKKGDDRTTWIGAILRKSSLDELPQFINVLKGEMSCVGPRPERPVFVEKFRKEIPGYMLRHKVKAGITGWAQVNGLRGNTSLEDRIEYDLFYITHWSLAFDLRIMLMTVFKGFFSPNAY